MTDLLNRANVDIAINTLLDDLQPNDAIQPSDHNGLLKDILDTLSNGLSTTLRTGNTTGGFDIDITDGDNIQYNKGGSFVGVLDSLTLTGSRSWDFPDNSGTIALLSDITGGDNLGTADLTQTDLDRVYTRSAVAGISRLRLQGSSSELVLEDARSINMFVGKYDTAGAVPGVTFNASAGNTGFIGLANDTAVIKGVSSELKLYGGFGGVLQSEITLSADIHIKPNTNRSIKLQTDNIFFQNRIGNITYGHIDDDEFYWGGTNPIGGEKFSIQVDTLIKGSDNALGTSGFKVTDVNNNSLVDIRNNGQTCWGGVKVNNVAHIFYNPSNQGSSLARFYESDGNIGINLATGGRIEANQGGLPVFKTYRIGSVPHIELYHNTNGKIVDLQSGNCYINGTSLTVGGTTGKNKAEFSIIQGSSNNAFQKFFGNITTTTAGRLGSDTGFGTNEKGLECFDTTLNKKVVWNGTAWEQVASSVNAGFTGTGNFTNFTIVDGVITNAT